MVTNSNRINTAKQLWRPVSGCEVVLLPAVQLQGYDCMLDAASRLMMALSRKGPCATVHN